MEFPAKLQINAWGGAEVDNRSTLLSSEATSRVRGSLNAQDSMLAPDISDSKNWEDERVGWGLLVIDDPNFTDQQKVDGKDLAEPLRALCKERQDAPVFRYNPEDPTGILRRYKSDGSIDKPSIGAMNHGIGNGKIPKYLLLYGSPQQLPWRLQFRLQASLYVGRLDLEGEALENYVKALIRGWAERKPVVQNTLFWSVDHGKHDITRLMRRAVSEELIKSFKADIDYSAGITHLTGEEATQSGLSQALNDKQPGLIVSTSHGATQPIGDVGAMQESLGLLIDKDYDLTDPASLLNNWQPSGAIWYSHACCSAGASGRSEFVELVEVGSGVERILSAVEKCGDMVSPLPKALLGAANPIRAFIGHVEPTFDWSLWHPNTKQFLSTPLKRSLYQALFTGEPIGMAMQAIRAAGSLHLHNWEFAKDRRADGEDMRGELLALRLIARDWASLVVIGDPTCKLPIEN